MKITRTSHGKRYVTTELVKPHVYLPSVGFTLTCASGDPRDASPQFSVGLAHDADGRSVTLHLSLGEAEKLVEMLSKKIADGKAAAEKYAASPGLVPTVG